MVVEPVDAFEETDLRGVFGVVGVVLLIDQILSSIIIGLAEITTVNISDLFSVVELVEDVGIREVDHAQLQTVRRFGNLQASLGDVVEVISIIAFLTRRNV